MTDTAPTIVAAAIQLSIVEPATKKQQTVIVSAPPPARHHTLLNPLSELAGLVGFIGPDDQGFLTSEGKFLGRIGAACMAMDAGQIKKLKFNEHELFSEDLW